MKNYIKIVSILLIAFAWACNKDDDEGQSGETVKNTMRVKKVSGHNEAFGDFQFQCAYSSEQFDSAGIYSPQGKKLGLIETSYNGNIINFYVTKRVQGVDDETAAEMDPDSIPMTSVNLYAVGCRQRSAYPDSIAYAYYGPIEHEPGERYKVKYEVKSKVHCLLEYNKQGRLMIWRSPGNYATDNRVYKGVINQESNRVVSIDNYLYQEDWQVIAPNTYHWEGDLLMKVSGNYRNSIYETEFTYSGRFPEQAIYQENGKSKTISYQFNSQGFVTKIDEGNGNYMNIEYENGHGNFGLLTPFFQKLTGLPYIK